MVEVEVESREEAGALVVQSLSPQLRERMERDPANWIHTFVKIEDADSPEPVPFHLWPEQRRALQAFIDNRLTIVLKSRQLGLTWLALSYAVWRMLLRPGYKVVALSRGEDEAKELVRRMGFILRNLTPPWVVPGRAPVDGIPSFEATTEKVVIHHPGGEDAVFQSFPAAQDSGRSFTAALVIIDEWAAQVFAEEIWTAAYPTINRPTGGQVIGLSTAKRGVFFEWVWNAAEKGENGFFPVFLSWKADPRRDRAWYEATKKAMPKSYRREYPANSAEAFSPGEGAAFLEWDEDVHVAFDETWYPPRDWKIIRAYDGGYMSRACCKWYAISPDGLVVAYREYYPRMVTDADQATRIRELSVRPDGTDERISYTVADPASWQKKSANGVATAEVFARNGVYMKPADNDRINGWKRLHEWFQPFEGQDEKPCALLRFTRSCRNTIRCYPGLEVDKNEPDDINTDGEDHCADTDRYFVMSRPSAPRTEDEERRSKRTRKKLTKPVSSITGY